MASRLALTHLSTMSQYTPAQSPVDSGELHPPIMVNNTLFRRHKLNSRPTVSLHLYPPFSTREPHSAAPRVEPMAIEAPLSVRANEQTRRDDAREAAAQYLATRAEWRRDTRVEEAKASAAARPTVADRAVDTERRPRSKSANGKGQVIDVLA